MPENTVNINVSGDAALDGVAIGDRNKIISHVQAQGHVVQADHSQVHIGDIYYYFEIPKSDVIKKEPYKFLSTYTLADADIFFGRKQAIEALSTQILAHKLVIINGKSGSGKSSLMHAGVTPKLLRNNQLVIHITDYRDTPVPTIQDAIQGGLESPVVIFLDQFERFFIYLPLPEQQRFTAALRDWLADDTLKVRFVIAIRMDFFGRLSEFQPLIPNLYQQSAIFPLLPLNRDEAREAIEGPLDALNIRIVYEPELLDTLLDNLLEESEIEPAQLQIVCDELYRRAQANNAKIINAALYEAAGGVKGMLENYLQRKLAEYTPDDDEVKAILKQMIAPVEVSAGIRTFVDVAHITERVKASKEDVERLITRLVDDRLIEKKSGEETYSIAHEYLAGQVQQWFDPRETAIRRARDILDHAVRYDTLMPYEEASQVKEYASDLEINDTESTLLQRSLRKYSRGVWLRRGIVAVITLFTVIAASLGFYANLQRKDALFQKDEAQKAQTKAETKEQEAVTAQQKAEEAEKTTKQQLSLNYFSNGMTARDLFKDWLKASHYFMKTAAFTDDPALARNARLASNELVKSIWPNVLLHKAAVKGAVFSRDESRILTWSDDGTARTWESTTGQPLTPSLEHKGPVKGAVFNQDETRILTWSEDGTTRVWDSLTGQPLTPSLEHKGPVKGAVFSQDETRILTWSADGTARVWDSLTGQPLTLPLENAAAGAVFSRDETRILTWGGSAVRVWDSRTGPPLTPPLAHQNDVYGAVFNRDETRILTWGWGAAQLWDRATGQPLTSPLEPEDKGLVNGAAFSQDESRVLTWSGTPPGGTGTVRVWDSLTGQPLTPPFAHGIWVHGTFNREATRVLTWSSAPGTAQVWDSATGQPLTPSLENAGGGAVFSRDETRILTWGQNTYQPWDRNTYQTKGVARVWDSATGQPLTPPLEHQGTVYGSVFSRDETRILTWGGSAARVWDSLTGQPLTPPLAHKDTVNGAVFTQDETRILTWSKDGTARVWDVSTALNTGGVADQSLTPPLKHKDFLNGAVFSQDETRILTWSGEYGKSGAARVWDSATGQPLTPPLEHKDAVNGAVFSRDETRILTWSNDGTARVWDSLTGQPLTPPLENAGDSVVFSQDETRILAWSNDGTARAWDSLTGRPLTLPLENADDSAVFATGQTLPPSLEHKGPVKGVVSSRDETRILTWSEDDTARVWDSATGQPLTPPLEHSGGGAAFSRAETRILTWSYGGMDGTARVWDSATGQPLTPPLEHKNAVNGAAFSRDETRILTWSADGTARVWDSATGQPLTPPLENGLAYAGGGAVFSQDETRILMWGGDAARVWELQTDDDFPQEHLSLQLAVQTNPRMNDLGDLAVLSTEEWQTQHDQYVAIAREHLKTCNFPQANLWLKRLLYQPDSCDRIGDWLSTVNPAVAAEVTLRYARVCLSHGDFWFKKQEYERATRAFETALQLQTLRLPESPQVDSTLLAETYAKLGRPLIASGQNVVQGIEYAQKSLELNPHQFPDHALHTLALGYRQQGERQKAAAAYVNLAQAYVRWREYVLALEAYQQAMELEPEIKEKIVIEVEHTKIRAYAQQEKYPEALDAYHQAIERYPEIKARLDVTAYKAVLDHVIQTYQQEGKDAEVEREYARTIQSGLGDAQTRGAWLTVLAQTFVKEKKFKDALAAYTEARKLDPTVEIYISDWDTLCRNGSLHGAAAEVLDACEHAVNGAESEADKAYFRDSRGMARALTGNVAGAIEDFQAFVAQTTDEKAKAQRQQWIEALQKGENPFTSEVLDGLK
jgi:WD40 repeat protein/tetratricopeptide (TPR) repeat protein